MVFISLTAILGKRIRSVDEHDSILDSKIFNTAPSERGKLYEYKSLQQDQDTRILDDRPEQDLLPPASLLYDGFGYFMDIFRCRKDVRDLTLERRDLELDVDVFSKLMTNFHDDEYTMKKGGIFTLNKIMSLGDHKLMSAGIDSSDAHMDGHCNGPHGAVSCIVKFKNELVDTHSIPLVELTSCVARSHARAMNHHRELYMGWRVPCLGITIVGKPDISRSSYESNIVYVLLGPYVTFYAIIYLPRLRVVSLTPALSCISSAGEGDDRTALYAAFSGALDLLRRIDEDATRFLSVPPKIEHRDRKFPYISELPKHNAPGEVHFRIFVPYPAKEDYCLLYVAKTLDGKDIMVKFTRQYSIELHAFCAERGHAPAIHGFKQIPGGWSVVAMDLILPPEHPSQSPKLTRLFDKWVNDLQTLMQDFHDKGLVHGDLREPNILCNGEKVMLIDFDWGGKVGEACYPHARLCSELIDGRDSTDRWIMKGDDERVLQNTLEGLKMVASTSRTT